MKKLILLFTICLLTSCTGLTSTPLIVTSIGICKSCDYNYYIIELNNTTTIYSNTYYNIGDTLN
jgi:hypothetical protein